ncbi:unnamed protein product [Peronospora belbahrii]|uniref:40S ribosomal protein S27 n=1 Tax=Peronospora belbahrii TaxID=622444 RepID=A0AAU9L2J3_9STRA|nr:unnamed protein product [Peronospora belbahrii]CAH0517578.1 unnamed protein product [Peronospora belbahrii]
MPRDLLHPSAAEEASKHKLRRLVQTPNSYFMDVKCPGCFNITTVFSHAQTVVLCGSCSVMLCQPTGACCQFSSWQKVTRYSTTQGQRRNQAK